MKKRVLSLIVCLAMLSALLLCFAGCGGGISSSVQAGDAKAQTLVLAMIKGEKTTDAAVKAVEEALNEITEADYNTRIILKMYTPDEYQEQILKMSANLHAKQAEFENATFDKYGNLKDKNMVLPADVREFGEDVKKYTLEANGDYSYFDEEYNRPITVFPTPSDPDQLDIVFIDSIDTYTKLVEKNYIISLSTDLVTDGSLKKYVNNQLIDRAKKVGNTLDVGGDYGMVYAIPNNYVASDYRYLLVNKKLYDYYQYDIMCDMHVNITGSTGCCDDITDFIEYLTDVADNNEELKAAGSEYAVDKLLYNFMDLRWVSYFENGIGDAAVMGNPSAISFAGQLTDTAPVLVKSQGSIFQYGLFKNTYSLVNTLINTYGDTPYYTGEECFYTDTAESIGYPAPAAKMEDNAETFALAMVAGDAAIEKYYDSDDYYVVKTNCPVVDNEMFSSMFAISSFSSTAEDDEGLSLYQKIGDYDSQQNPRCFEIITALENDPEVINLLTYGIAGLHYDVFDNDPMLYNVGKTTSDGDVYEPIVGKAGNLFMTYQHDAMSAKELYYSAKTWQAAKDQNLGIIISPYCGFSLTDVPRYRYLDAESRENESLVKEYNYSAREIGEHIDELYEEYFAQVWDFINTNKGAEGESFEDFLKAINTEIKANEWYELATTDILGETDSSFYALPAGQYRCFYQMVYKNNPGMLSDYVDMYWLYD